MFTPVKPLRIHRYSSFILGSPVDMDGTLLPTDTRMVAELIEPEMGDVVVPGGWYVFIDGDTCTFTNIEPESYQQAYKPYHILIDR